MFIATIERQIKAIMNKLIGHSFPEPVETITTAMRSDFNIHTLREINVRMNGKTVGVCLNYCSCAASGQEYSVSGYNLDKNGHFAEFFPTQDEAEQEYIVRASYVHAAMNQAGRELGGELLNIGAKLHLLEEHPECADGMHSWTGEVGLLPPDTRCTRPGCDAVYGHPD